MKAVALAQGLDLLTFGLAIGVFGVSISAESNGLMRSAYLLGGLALVALFKTTATTCILAAIGLLYARSPRPAIWIGYGLGMLGFCGNMGAMLRG